MSSTVIETVTFRIKDGITQEQLVEAAKGLNNFLDNQPGFVMRHLSCAEDGLWIEHIEWKTMEEAKAAAEAIWTVEANKPFLSAIDGDTIKMHHSHVMVAHG